MKMLSVMFLFLMTSFISYVTMICASCKKQFLHKSIKGVEIVKWQRKKCIRQFVLIAERNAKYPSNLTQADLFTAVSAGLRREPQEEDSKST